MAPRPDIAGRGIANPIGQIWSGAMMLRHLGAAEAADAVESGDCRNAAQAKVRTPDIGATPPRRNWGRRSPPW